MIYRARRYPMPAMAYADILRFLVYRRFTSVAMRARANGFRVGYAEARDCLPPDCLAIIALLNQYAYLFRASD